MTPALDDCLRLLRGGSDEQRLAGLLLATKFCQGDDHDSILKIYRAVGPVFLKRLLKTGMMEGNGGDKDSEREAYLRLSVTLLAAFCRVPQIAASEDMLSQVPTILEIISRKCNEVISEECYEFLLSVSSTTDGGARRVYESGIMKVLASSISILPDGCRTSELVLKLLQILLTNFQMDTMILKFPQEMACLVMCIARQFGLMHTGLKFDALHLLTTILSSKHAAQLQELRARSNELWAAYARIGIVAVLQNRVVPAEKLQALALADSIMEVVGEEWMVADNNIPGLQDPMQPDKCLLLVLESARVEVAVLLNELAYEKYEASNSAPETFFLKQQNLAVLYSLMEKIIKLISSDFVGEGSPVDEGVLMKAINGLNETVSVVLDYLNDAKDHDHRKGDELLASVRFLGSYLAETPFVCKEKVWNILKYILSVEGQSEQCPFYSVCFMLPMLCQTTADIDGCKVLLSCEGHKTIVNWLLNMTKQSRDGVEDTTTMLACDAITNIFLNGDKVQIQLDATFLSHLLCILALLAEKNSDPSVALIVSSTCILVFDMTTEDELLKAVGFNEETFILLCKLVARSLDASQQVESLSSVRGTHELREIIFTGFNHCVNRFPSLRSAVQI